MASTLTSSGNDALSETARDAWSQTFVAHRAITREVERRLQEQELPPLAWFDVLHTIRGSDDGRIKQTALAARVQVSPSGLSRLLDRMVGRSGVVRRCEVPGDRRATELVVTDSGDELLVAIWAVYGGVLSEHFAPAIAGQEGAVSRVFGDVSDSLQGICETRIAEAEAACEEAEAAADADASA